VSAPSVSSISTYRFQDAIASGRARRYQSVVKRHDRNVEDRRVSRSQRLLDLLQILRSHRMPVSGTTLAAQTGVSLRTLYRDIATLQVQGADIEGEAGVGYVLRPGFLLPPLMFSPQEIEALVLGSRWVAGRADEGLAEAARAALVKIGAVLPDALREELDNSTLLIGPGQAMVAIRIDLALIRDIIRKESKVAMTYRDEKGELTERVIWPFALAFFDLVRVVLAWCETRQDFRSFRADRIESFRSLDKRYPRRRQALLKEWREREKQRRRQDHADRN
jgi:predicted DNA-binding transcriptional regulator YafY